MSKSRTFDVTVFGIGSSRHQFLKKLLRQNLDSAEYHYQLNEVTDVDKFIDFGIESIPAVVIDHKKIFENKSFVDLQQMADEVEAYLATHRQFKLDTIVVPTDFSKAATNALRYAAGLAEKFAAKIKVLHVYHPVIAPDYVETDKLQSEVEHHRGDQIRGYIQRSLPEAFTNEVSGHMQMGFPAEQIVEESSRQGIGMIVIGSTGEHHAIDKIFGSISSFVALNARCPVLLVPRAVSFRPLRNIVFATNSRILEERMLHLVEELCAQFNATLQLIHVQEDSEMSAMPETRSALAQRNAFLNIEEKVLADKSVMLGLNKFINDHPVDLVIMATHRRNFWKKLIHRSLTKQVALTTEVPLLVFHVP